MPKYDAVIFDLDGTLVDTIDDIADNVNAVLVRHGFPPNERDAYFAMVGRGLRNLVERVLPPEGRDSAIIERITGEIIERYDERPVTRSRPYDGIPELLARLSSNGVAMAVLSNKADSITRKIVDALFSGIQFVAVRGLSPDVPRKPDPASALAIAAAFGRPRERVLYVGDSEVDMETAVRASMFPVGVAWGFRTTDELFRSGARVVVKDPATLEAVFFG